MLNEVQAIRAQAMAEGKDFVWIFHQLKDIGIESYGFDLHEDKKTLIRQQHIVEERTGMEPLQFGSYDLMRFKQALKAHQHGKLSYEGWLKETARCGIYRYIVMMEQAVVVYLNAENTQAYVESVPSL